MKFIKFDWRKTLRHGSYISLVKLGGTPIKFYGYIRIFDGLIILQSKNAIQTFNGDKIAHIKPNGCRFWKIKIYQKDLIEILVD